MFHELFCWCPGAKTLKHHMHFNFSSKMAHLLSPRMASWRKPPLPQLPVLLFQRHTWKPHLRTPTCQMQAGKPHRKCAASSSFATLHRGWARPPICSMLMPHNLHGPLLPVYLDWVSTIFFLSPEGSTTQGLQLHECLTTPTTGLLEPRPEDICLQTYPKPPTSCVTPI